MFTPFGTVDRGEETWKKMPISACKTESSGLVDVEGTNGP